MKNLLFIHGVGVRDDSWASLFELISDKAAKFLPEIKVHGCQWGTPFGARLHRGGEVIPGYGAAGGAEARVGEASESLWFLLGKDPLLEVRVSAEEPYFGPVPGDEILALLPGLAANAKVMALLHEWSISYPWPGFVAGIVADEEWRETVGPVTASVPAMSLRMARAMTAAYQRHIRPRGFPGLTGAQRDRLVDELVSPLGGPPYSIKNWLLERLTHFGANRRGGLTDFTTPAVGDVIRYQARGEEIRKFIRERVQGTGSTIILAHSLGGIASVDWLASNDYAAQEAHIEALITAGSQAPYFYEIDALVSRTYGSGLPNNFPNKWLNFYDKSDFLSYRGEPAFPGHVLDVEVENGQPFPESHSAYWQNDEVWKAMREFLKDS